MSLSDWRPIDILIGPANLSSFNSPRIAPHRSPRIMFDPFQPRAQAGQTEGPVTPTATASQDPQIWHTDCVSTSLPLWALLTMNSFVERKEQEVAYLFIGEWDTLRSQRAPSSLLCACPPSSSSPRRICIDRQRQRRESSHYRPRTYSSSGINQNSRCPLPIHLAKATADPSKPRYRRPGRCGAGC